MNAKNWVQSGKAHNLEALRIVGEIFDHLKKHNQRLYLVYVPSAENVADYATRYFGEQTFLQKQFDQTRRLLHLAQKEATGMWLNQGGRTGGLDPQLGKKQSEKNIPQK